MTADRFDELEALVAALGQDVAFLHDMYGDLKRLTDALTREREELQRQLDALHDWVADLAAAVWS